MPESFTWETYPPLPVTTLQPGTGPLPSLPSPAPQVKASLQDIIDHVAAWKKNPIKDVVGGGNSLGHGGGGSMIDKVKQVKETPAPAPAQA